MTLIQILFVLLSTLVVSQTFAQGRVAPSFASSTQHEFDVSLSRIGYESYKTEERSTDINLYAGYHYQIDPLMQLGAEGGLISVPDKSDTKTVIAALGVYTYNFASPIRDSLFVQGGAGLFPAYDKEETEYESSFSYFAGAGMRFEVWGKINYRPYIRIWKRGEEDMRFELQLLSFSIFF